jgi:hypothetical protein
MYEWLYTMIHMAALFKAFAIFWVIWILWYVTGGPLRDDKSHPYIGLNEGGQLETMSTSSIRR